MASGAGAAAGLTRSERQAAQRREHAVGDESAIVLPEVAMMPKEIAQHAVGRLLERQHGGQRVGQRAELARADGHCCATVSSTRMLSSRPSTVARALDSRSLTIT